MQNIAFLVTLCETPDVMVVVVVEYFGSGRIASLTTDDKKDHRVTNHPHEKVSSLCAIIVKDILTPSIAVHSAFPVI